MHIRAITPIHVDDTELARRRARYQRLAPPGISITLENLPAASQVPRQLAAPEDVKASNAAVTSALRALDPGEVDAGLPDCVLDPGISSRGSLAVPVYGITELAAGVTTTLGMPFTAVARNRTIADELDRIVTGYGYRRFAPTRVLELSVEAIADDQVWNDTVARLTRELATTDVRWVLNGCSAVDVRPDPSGVAVFDPTRLALDTLSLAREHALVGTQEAIASG